MHRESWITQLTPPRAVRTLPFLHHAVPYVVSCSGRVR
jgi:hypothetical protein